MDAINLFMKFDIETYGWVSDIIFFVLFLLGEEGGGAHQRHAPLNILSSV